MPRTIAELHREFLIDASRIVKIYKRGSEYSSLTLAKDDQGHLTVMDAYGFSTEKVTDDASLESELAIQFPAKTAET